MRIATIASGAAIVAPDDTVIPVADLVAGAPADVRGVIEAGDALWSRLRDAAASARGGRPVAQAGLRAPIPEPRRDVFAVGWNYSEHFVEGKILRGTSGPEDVPEHPALFSKGPNTVVGHEAGVRYPAPHSEQLDWEVELAVVIGTPGRDIAADRALAHVFGYTAANDVSVRDVQQKRHGGQWFKGKNFDTHLPMGPWIVTADEIPNPHELRLSTRVNGVTKQDSSTKHMVFTVPRIIEEISAGLALVPADMIITGTPPGVGFARKPPEWMKVGDTVEVEIERIGTLRNRIVAE